MQLEHSRTLTAVASVSIADCSDMPYSPALLLDGRLDASITDNSDFHDACEWGFNSYFDGMSVPRPGATSRGFDDFMLVEKRYTAHYVIGEIVANMREINDDNRLVSAVGVSLGWLSALAFVQRLEALQGLEALMLLVRIEQAKLVQVQVFAA